MHGGQSPAGLGTLRWHAAGHATTSWCMCATASARPRPSRLQPQPDAVVCCTMATSPALSRAAVGLAEWRADRPRVLMRQHGSARGLADLGSLFQQSAPLPAKPINMAASSVACMRSKPFHNERGAAFVVRSIRYRPASHEASQARSASAALSGSRSLCAWLQVPAMRTAGQSLPS